MGLYIVANVDGNVISSTDGINWSAPFNTGISIEKVAIGPNKIVYAGGGEGGEGGSPGLYHASAWDQTPVLVEGTDAYSYNEVHYLGNKFVAVGCEIGSPTFPAFAYSEDGVNWTIGQIDPGYAIIGGEGGEGNDIEFTDVGYNGTGYFITSRVSGENLAGGFYTTDLSAELSESDFVSPENFPVDAKQLVYAEYPEGGENFGAWSAFSDDQKTWFSTFNEDPSQPWDFINGWDLSEVLQSQIGLSDLNIAEATIGLLDGYVIWMLSTTNGQIIWWPHVPAGPFISIPKPFTATVNSVNNLNPLEINMSSSGNLPSNNERITIEGSTGVVIDGVYFVESLGSDNYRLYANSNLENPVDASGLTGTYNDGSATIKMSRGTYIDALGYGDGKFFAGNDDEEVFVCSVLAESYGGEGEYPELIWTKVDDQNNSFEYWNDVSYGDFQGCQTTSYSYELSPDNIIQNPNYKYDGEGNMDTAIVINEDGSRTSIQRTGYFDYLDGCGNRKVVEIRDGEETNDSPETAEITNNSNGHPTFGENDNPTITEQNIPTGNPFIS